MATARDRHYYTRGAVDACIVVAALPQPCNNRLCWPMVFRAEKSHVTPLFLWFALSRSPCGPKNDHRRARCAVRQQSHNMTLTLQYGVSVMFLQRG